MIFRSRAWVTLASVFFLSVSFLGCVLYQRTKPIIKVPDFYELKALIDGLYVIVDPYATSGKIQYLFGTDITKKGVYTVHLILQNWSDQRFDFSESRAFLVGPEGDLYTPMDREAVTEKVLRNTTARMIGFGALGSPPFFILTIPFATGGGLDSYLSNIKIREDVQSKRLEREKVLEGKTIRQGFLFFQVAQTEEEARERFAGEYRFRLERIRNLTTDEFSDVEIPIRE